MAWQNRRSRSYGRSLQAKDGRLEASVVPWEQTGGCWSAPSGVQQQAALPEDHPTQPVEAGGTDSQEGGLLSGDWGLRSTGLRHFPPPDPHLRPTLCPQVKWCVCAQLCLTLQLHGLQPARLLCPWNCLGQNTGVRGSKSKRMLLRNPPPTASLLWPLHSRRNVSGIPPAVSSAQSHSSVAWRGCVLLEPLHPHIPGMQVSQVPRFPSGACSDWSKVLWPEVDWAQPWTWQWQRGQLWGALDGTWGCSLGGHMCVLQPSSTHTHTYRLSVQDGMRVGRITERAVCQVRGLGLGGMPLSASNSKEMGNSKFKLTFQANTEVYL